jgi:hypothetical protein
MRPAAATGLLLLAALAPPAIAPRHASASAAAEEAPYRILPGPRVRKSSPPAGRPAPSRFVLRGLTVEVEFLEPEDRARFIRTLDPRSDDPFAVPPGRPQAYHAFRITFENDSAKDVLFQPGNVLLMTAPTEQQRPLDLTDLYRVAARSETADPDAAMERAARLIFDSSTTIPKGRTLSRLVVFGPLPRKWKELRLLFSFLQIGSETHSLSFTFHKQILEGRG